MNKLLSTIFVKKQVNCRFGVSLFPNHPYSAVFSENTKRWSVQVSPTTWVSVSYRNVSSKVS